MERAALRINRPTENNRKGAKFFAKVTSIIYIYIIRLNCKFEKVLVRRSNIASLNILKKNFLIYS